jgi:hypothetical protein
MIDYQQCYWFLSTRNNPFKWAQLLLVESRKDS